MSSSQVDKNIPETIPVIDISPLRDGSNPMEVAKKLHAASANPGFIYVRGHGIDDAVIENARNTAYEFFRSPENLKSEVRISAKHRGWISSGGAKMDDDLKPDMKESFLWSFEPEDGELLEDHTLRGPNQWPNSVPLMRNNAMLFFREAHKVAHILMRGFAIGLNLREDFFLKTSDKPLSRGSFVYYPDQSGDDDVNRFGVGPHTDFGVLTILAQDDVGGLEVQTIDGSWISAPPIEGTLIVNVADLLHRWTNGTYRSTPHRVINRSGRERLSLVLAYDPNPETIVDPRDIFGADYTGGKPAITCGEYLDWRFNKAFSYRSSKNDQ